MGARGIRHKTNKGLVGWSYKNFSKISMKNILLKKCLKGISGQLPGEIKEPKECFAFLVVCPILCVRACWGCRARPAGGCELSLPCKMRREWKKWANLEVKSQRNDSEQEWDSWGKSCQGEWSRQSQRFKRLYVHIISFDPQTTTMEIVVQFLFYSIQKAERAYPGSTKNMDNSEFEPTDVHSLSLF